MMRLSASLDGANEALCVSVQIRRSGRQLYHFDAFAFEQTSKGRGILGVPIEDEIPLVE